MKASILKLKNIARWLLLVLVIMYIITGLGISHFRIIESLTFGLLTKSLSFKIHGYLLIPFLILLVLHVFPFIWPKKK